MNYNRFAVLKRLLLFLATLCLALSCLAQQAPQAPTAAPTKVGPNTAHMKMRGTTMAQRRAAAKRISQRKLAHGMKNRAVQPKHNGGAR